MIDPLIAPTAVALVGLAGLQVLPRRRSVFKVAWVGAVLALFTLLFAPDVGSPLQPVYMQTAGLRAFWAGCLEAFWWLAAARLAVAVVRVWTAADHKADESRLASDIIAGVVYIVALLAITNDVFRVPVRGLLATSGVIAIVLGLALQSTLADVFSGISINIERPFRPGDVIQIDGVLEGTVVQTNWRATHVHTGVDDVAVVPNSVIAKSRIINRSQPTTVRAVGLPISLTPATAPEDGTRALLHAAMTTPSVLRDPAPSVDCLALRGDRLDYEIIFHVASNDVLSKARTDLISRVFHQLAWDEIAVAPTDRLVLPAAARSIEPPLGPPATTSPAAADQAATPEDGRTRRLRATGLFDALSAEELAALARKVTKRSPAAGEVVIRQGGTGDSLYIIRSGVLEVVRDTEDGQALVIGRMGAGDHFGEIGLLTGEAYGATATALTRSSIYEVAHADLAPLLAARPDLLTHFCAVVEHQRVRLSGPANPASQAAEDHRTGEQLLRRVEAFFHLSAANGSGRQPS